MNEYSRFIDPCRRSVPVSKQLVDADGSCVFGTFDSEFESMDLLRAKKPTYAPQFLNRFKLTLWEAAEINLKEGVLLAVVCDMGFFGKILICTKVVEERVAVLIPGYNDRVLERGQIRKSPGVD